MKNTVGGFAVCVVFLERDASWLEHSTMSGFFEHFGGPLIEALACRLRGNQCRAVHFRWHSQHELARRGLLRTNRLFLAVAQELFDGRLQRGTQLGHGFTVTGNRMPTQSPHKPNGAGPSAPARTGFTP